MCGKKTNAFVMLAVSLLILLTSCRQNNSENSSRKSSDRPLKSSIADVKKEENAKKLTINLPVKLDSSAYLIYPIGELSTAVENRSFKSSYKSEDRYNGYLTNLIFQNIYTDKTHFLTRNTIKIMAYEQLFNTQRVSEKIILYQVIDNFPEDEGMLTFNSLYLGTNDGKLFQKISKANEHVTDWKYIPETKKVYFKTIEDTDQNNEFNTLDKEHIYSVSLQNFKVINILKDALKTL